MDIIPQEAPKHQPRTDPIFFVYFFYRNESQVPFYVGKGSGKRDQQHFICARKRETCQHLTCRIIRKEWRTGGNVTSVKIAEGILEKDAFQLERFFISIGAISNWPLVNKTDGGEGVSGYIRDEEWRKRRSALAKKMVQEGKYEHLKTVNIGRTHTPDVEKRRIQRVADAWSDPDLREWQGRRSKQVWESEEFRQKHQQSMHTPEVQAKLAYWKDKESPQAKTYPGFMAPDGTIYSEVKNLTRFAHEHGLQVSGMCLVAQGKQSQHLGWTLFPPIAKHPYKGCGFVSPHGEIFADIAHLSHFCEQHGLKQNVMSEVARGKRKSHKGWTRYIPDEPAQPSLF